jgi:hypothetical protein
VPLKACKNATCLKMGRTTSQERMSKVRFLYSFCDFATSFSEGLFLCLEKSHLARGSIKTARAATFVPGNTIGRGKSVLRSTSLTDSGWAVYVDRPWINVRRIDEEGED